LFNVLGGGRHRHIVGWACLNDRAQAIAEMIRVARPGTKIVIVDETEKVVKDVYERVPLSGKSQKEGRYGRLPCRPGVARNVGYHSEGVSGGRLYCLSFRKP